DFDGSTKGTFDGTTFNSLGFHPGPSVATSTGDLWIANSQGGLDRYDGLTITVYDTANSGLPQQTVDHLTADPNDRLWFSMYATDTVMWTTQYTIGTFDGTSWQEYTADNSALPLITELVKDLGI